MDYFGIYFLLHVSLFSFLETDLGSIKFLYSILELLLCCFWVQSQPGQTRNLVHTSLAQCCFKGVEEVPQQRGLLWPPRQMIALSLLVSVEELVDETC